MELCREVLVFFSLIGSIFAGRSGGGFDSTLFEIVGGLADAFEKSTNCKYECPAGQKPVARTSYSPKSNGCGAYGIQLDTDLFPSITECCNKHDICYGTCNKSRKSCDNKFAKCLEKVCDRMEDAGELTSKQTQGCRSTANIFTQAAAALGCSAFLDAQELACECRGQRINAEL